MNSLILISPGRAGFQPILSGKSRAKKSHLPAKIRFARSYNLM
ncbi:hypothetical protein [Microcoleus sp. CAWBG58]|nr:hypothetical protein [Microcoleus sp. CAWBG58]